MSYKSFEDLRGSDQLDEKMSYEFFIFLLDQLFGQHDHMRIDIETESDQNHGIIILQWKLIKQYFGLPSSVKKTQKLVRQTLLQIANRLNEKYHFQQPIKYENKRRDYYDKEQKKNVTEYWVEFLLN
jgi:hypothetical protein